MGGVLGPLGAGLECEVRVVPVVLRLEERREAGGRLGQKRIIHDATDPPC